MAKNIGSCKQHDANQVYAYDESGGYMFNIAGVLLGYTPTTVTVRTPGGNTYLYNNEGHYVRSI